MKGIEIFVYLLSIAMIVAGIWIGSSGEVKEKEYVSLPRNATVIPETLFPYGGYNIMVEDLGSAKLQPPAENVKIGDKIIVSCSYSYMKAMKSTLYCNKL